MAPNGAPNSHNHWICGFQNPMVVEFGESLALLLISTVNIAKKSQKDWLQVGPHTTRISGI